MPTNKLELLKNFTLFKNLDQNELKNIAEKLVEKHFEKGELIIEQNDTNQNVYFICSGIVRIYRMNPDGKEINLVVVGEGQTIGEMSPIIGGERTAFVEAQSDVETLILEGDILKNLIIKDTLAMNFIKILCERLSEANKHLEEVMSKNLKERTLTLLLSLSRQLSTKNLEITQEELANILSATRPRVSEVLQELHKEKIVDLGHKAIKIL
jgi:CRP/FNR family transcriptional regulator